MRKRLGLWYADKVERREGERVTVPKKGSEREREGGTERERGEQGMRAKAQHLSPWRSWGPLVMGAPCTAAADIYLDKYVFSVVFALEPSDQSAANR